MFSVMKVYSFEKLEVYSDAKDYVVDIYKITSTFPDTENLEYHHN